jgi:NAD(P)-dependent dehydrogenase (short-subunit alcohol dehydrogenase family)
MNIVLTGASSGIGFEAALEFALNKDNKSYVLPALRTNYANYWKLQGG